MAIAVLTAAASGAMFGFLLGLSAGMRGRYRPDIVHQGPLRTPRSLVALETTVARHVHDNPLQEGRNHA